MCERSVSISVFFCFVLLFPQHCTTFASHERRIATVFVLQRSAHTGDMTCVCVLAVFVCWHRENRQYSHTSIDYKKGWKHLFRLSRVTGWPTHLVVQFELVNAYSPLSQTLYRPLPEWNMYTFNTQIAMHTFLSADSDTHAHSPKLLIYKFHYFVQCRVVPRTNKSNEHVKCVYCVGADHCICVRTT